MVDEKPVCPPLVGFFLPPSSVLWGPLIIPAFSLPWKEKVRWQQPGEVLLLALFLVLFIKVLAPGTVIGKALSTSNL